MIWIVLWAVGLVGLGRLTYLTLVSLSELPQRIAAVRRRRLFLLLCGGAVSALCFGLVVDSMRTNSTSPTIAIAVGGPALLLSYLAIRRARLSIGAYTPYDLEEPFDLFISYRRTLFAEHVRRIVEVLISQGVRLWLDDYAMFATNVKRDADLNASIRTGIKNSACGLIFESSDYEASPWCRGERRQMEERFRSSPDKILRLRHWTAGNERTEAEAILNMLQLQPPFARSPLTDNDFAEEPNSFRDERAGYQLDARGWAVVIRGGFFFPGSYKGPTLRYNKSPYRLSLNVDIGPAAAARRGNQLSWNQGDRYAIMWRAFDDLFKGVPDPGITEKRLWQAGYDFARSYAAMRGVAVHGSHVLVLGKEYHFAVTYWDKRGWVRRYSIIATDPATGVRLEIAIGFKFFGPFMEFCARAYQMDALVHSFRPLS